MSRRPVVLPAPPLAAAIGLTAILAACAPAPPPMPAGPLPGSFRVDDFHWSTRAGSATIEGRIDHQRDGRAYLCTGSVGLTPDTPYTRARFQALYGSTDRAALPEAVVRARTVPDPNADYRAFVRSGTCEGNRFSFSDLPDGAWFVIAPVSDGGDRVVLMRRVETRGGRPIQLTL